MNDLEREFIEGAARAMFVQAWADREENTCAVCSHDCRECDHALTTAATADEIAVHLHDFESRGRFGGMELMDVAPDTPDYARFEATKLLGAFEYANPQWGRNLPSIMAAAQRADQDFHHMHDPPGVDFPYGLFSPDVREFGHYIAMQALGHGVSWFDDHARFELKVPHVEFQLED